MKRALPARLRCVALTVPLAAAVLAASGDPAGRRSDPLAREIVRWKEFVSRHAAGGEDWDLWGIATPEVARSVGDVAAVPTLFLFDREGNPARTFYGAAPTLHAEAESAISALVAPVS